MEFSLDQALQNGIKAHKAGEVQEAESYYTAILNANPKHPDANHNLGLLAIEFGNIEASLPFLKIASESNSNMEQYWLSYIGALIQLDRVADAKAVFNQAKSKGVKGDSFDRLGLKMNTSSAESQKKVHEDIPTQANILNELALNKALKIANKKVKDGLGQEAKKIYQDILKKFPKNKKALEGIKILDSKTLTINVDKQDPPKEQLATLITLYNQQKLKKVFNAAKILSKRYTKSLTLWNLMGVSAAQIGKLDEAVIAFQKALSIKPDYAAAYLNMGNALKEQQKVEEAIEAYRQAFSIKPDYVEAYYNIGNAFRDQEKLQEAIEAYCKAISIKPDYADAYLNMGATLKNQEKLDEALVAYNNALKLKPDYAEAYNNKGMILKEQQKVEEAIEAYSKALSIKPNYVEVHYNLGNAFRDQEKLQEAIEAYGNALSIKPDHADAYLSLGNALKEQGKLDQAIEAYSKALSIKPDYADAYLNMGVTLKEQGKLDEAIVASHKALSIKPDYVEAYLNMGAIFEDQEKLDEAIGAYNKAISIKPDYADAHLNIGNVLKVQRTLDEAIEAYNKAISIKPDYADALLNISSIRKFTRKDEQFLQVQELYKSDGLSDEKRCKISFTLAKMYEDVGELDQAFRHLFAGNALRKKLLKYSFKQDVDLFNRLKETQPHFSINSLEIKESSIKPTPIFILGMPRSGTSLVEQIISSHSKVAGAGELKLVQHLGKKLPLSPKSISIEAISEFRQRYLSELSKLSHGKHFVTDKMPHNFLFIPLICAAFPEAKIVHVQRSPAATCWSNYKQYFAVEGLGYCYDLKDVVSYYSLYSDLMEFWQSEYSDRIYNLNYEKLTTDQEGETRELIDILGLDWNKACLSPHKNKRRVRTASIQQVRKKVYQGSSEVWREYEPYLGRAFNNLPSS